MSRSLGLRRLFAMSDRDHWSRGRRAVRALLAAGYRVARVTRSARGCEQLERTGARAVFADVFDAASLQAAWRA